MNVTRCGFLFGALFSPLLKFFAKPRRLMTWPEFERGMSILQEKCYRQQRFAEPATWDEYRFTERNGAVELFHVEPDPIDTPMWPIPSPTAIARFEAAYQTPFPES